MPATTTLRRFGLCIGAFALSACVTTRPPPPTVEAWPQRMVALQAATRWSVQGRAAAAVGSQGWQASLTWTQRGADSELHLSGPLGIGASVLRVTADGLSLNDARPNPEVVEQLQQRLGFELPLTSLRYWLLGVPAPDTPSEVTRNASDRAASLTQDGWTVDVDRYLPVGADVLPGHLVLHRDDVRVRVAIDQWSVPP